MTGSIRALVGFFIVFGAVGTMDYNPEASVLLQSALAVVGLVIMASGVKAMNRR